MPTYGDFSHRCKRNFAASIEISVFLWYNADNSILLLRTGMRHHGYIRRFRTLGRIMSVSKKTLSGVILQLALSLFLIVSGILTLQLDGSFFGKLQTGIGTNELASAVRSFLNGDPASTVIIGELFYRYRKNHERLCLYHYNRMACRHCIYRRNGRRRYFERCVRFRTCVF